MYQAGNNYQRCPAWSIGLFLNVNDFWKVYVAYANEVSAQLFALATTLFGLGLYTSLGQPNGNIVAGYAGKIDNVRFGDRASLADIDIADFKWVEGETPWFIRHEFSFLICFIF
jgi:hypothetical protein